MYLYIRHYNPPLNITPGNQPYWVCYVTLENDDIDNHNLLQVPSPTMVDWIRRIVSGNKARYKDPNLNLELDLVYLTPRIIIMGYPAEGFESFYRNNRDDARRFLEHRHGKNFWVFNFCPIRENSYEKEFFDGRVSRYPFPDHHAPPLAIMPLVAREISEWLDGAPERVVVLHCKAGKGRSGTMACTYLLSTERPPSPKHETEASEWAKVRANDVMKSVEHLEDASLPPTPAAVESQDPISTTNLTDALTAVLDLHTSRRMKPAGANEKAKQGVSIPSQRRWLHYWALLLAHAAPSHLWANPPIQTQPKVRLTRITVRMREAGALRINLVRAASALLDRTGRGKTGSAQAGGRLMWVSLARYDDSFVELLERWEQHTREPGGHMGRPNKHSQAKVDGEALAEVFDERGRWDKEKMVRSFARMGVLEDEDVEKIATEEGKMWSYTLLPLSESGWVNVRQAVQENTQPKTGDLEVDVPASEVNSIHDATESISGPGIVLDAGREVRIKIYMGQIFIGWAWFVPTFHMNQPHPSSSTDINAPSPTKFTLKRKQMDFPIGLGSSLVDVEIEMEWVQAADSASVQPPQTLASPEPEGIGLGMKLEAVARGGMGDAAEAKQAAQD
ncbi:Phosphatases II [Mycena indigotica]|uniref:phosphatidylinositol-3,4,5-trisphosphate 3-phosphatase n=1 Tax=Mycena indigotica TaxID=2126181 RepID=A0A8H6RZV9_9AGAR|nr:Phosphatases II [Mycena indigotica]KAF7289897.1 Phosphatases II [Mycena indigotica]